MTEKKLAIEHEDVILLAASVIFSSIFYNISPFISYLVIFLVVFYILYKLYSIKVGRLTLLHRFFILLGYVILSTIIHESGHFFAALILGVPTAPPSISFMFGYTPISIPPGLNIPLWKLWIVGLAGSTISLIAGVLIFKRNPLWGTILFLHSVLPNIVPIEGTDMGILVYHLNFPPLLAWIIFFSYTAVISVYLFEEAYIVFKHRREIIYVE